MKTLENIPRSSIYGIQDTETYAVPIIICVNSLTAAI